ncbi:MAG TPA: IS30 family transposase [Candidatus Kaiserbacteria bacterium]|nr:IS30 family transposase [Candidatus Kaiserbacteria bacterium]
MHTHITRDERVCLALMLQQGHSIQTIAEGLGFHRTTISREVKRNSGSHYDSRKAHKGACVRRKDSKCYLYIIDTNTSLKTSVTERLKKDWSPEQIYGTSGLVSFMTIYRFLDRHPHLKKHLRRQGKKRRKYGTRGIPSRYQANKHSIHNRIISDTVGHWEGDTIAGKERKLRIITHVDKYSGFLVAHLSDATANSVYMHTKNVLRKLPCSTITYDNGSEFALHKMIERVTGSRVLC